MLKRKRAIFIIIVIALILILFSGGYTFAKYFNLIPTAGGRAQIAKWSFKTINTSEKIFLKDSKLKDGKIAPGSNGEFKIEVDATDSDVSVDYQILISNETNIPPNMKFKAIIKDNEEIIKETDEKETLSELASTDLNGTIRFNDENKRRTIIVYWDWPYETEGGDISDTEIGTNFKVSSDYMSCSFDLEIMGKQSEI